MKKGGHWPTPHPHRDHVWLLVGISPSGLADGLCVLDECHTRRRFDRGQWAACKRQGNVLEDEESLRYEQQIGLQGWTQG